MPLMLCLTQDNLKKQKSGSELNVQHNEMLKITITYIYCQLVFDKSAKATQLGKNRLFNKQCWENWIPHAKQKEFGCPPLIIYKNQLYI